MPGVDPALLQQANKKISDLKDDIRRLSDELQKKESLLSSFMDIASVQSGEIASLSAVLRDTVAWDPAADPRLSSCSTPGQLPWTEVLVRGRKRDPDGSASPPGLNLSNRFASLSADNPAHPGDFPAAAPPCLVTRPAAPLPQMASLTPAAPPGQAVTPADQDNPLRPGLNQRLSSRSKTSTLRRQILKDAVLRCSGPPPRTKPVADAILRDVAATRQQPPLRRHGVLEAHSHRHLVRSSLLPHSLLGTRSQGEFAFPTQPHAAFLEPRFRLSSISFPSYYALSKHLSTE